jgi:hypothetical protein
MYRKMTTVILDGTGRLAVWGHFSKEFCTILRNVLANNKNGIALAVKEFGKINSFSVM